MFRAISFIQDPSTARAFELLSQQTDIVTLMKNYSYYPRLHELHAAVTGAAADVVFIELSDFQESISIVDSIRVLGMPIATIGFGAGWNDDVAARYVTAGLTEVLSSPVTPAGFALGIQKAIRRVRDGIQDNLIAFLPAKAGSGCTTIAMNAAGCLAKDLGKKTLLLESDLNSGVLSILLGLRTPRSILDVLEHAADLSPSLFSNALQYAEGLHLLCATRSRPLPSWSAYHHLLEFSKTRYDHILVDLPEVVNEATAEIFLRAKYIFVVCTPEIPSLMLAKRRCADLEARGISKERTGIILNRWHPTDKSEEEIEQLLERGIAAIIPNEYHLIQKATEARTFIPRETPVGREILAFSKRVAGIFEPDDDLVPKKAGAFDFLLAWAARRTV